MRHTNRIISLHRALIIFASGGLLFSAAQAAPVENPLYFLDYDKICKAGSPDAVKKSDNYTDRSNYRLVKRDHILDILQKKYPVALKVSADNSVKEQIANLVAPCGNFLHTLSDPDQVPSLSTAQKEKLNKCSTEANKASASRIKDKEALRMRRSLLRLFEAAETGSANDFVVIRKNWTAKLRTTENKFDEFLAIQYRPLVKPLLDDWLLQEYFASTSPPFEVACLGVGALESTAQRSTQLGDRANAPLPNLVPGNQIAVNGSTPIIDGAVKLIERAGKPWPIGGGDKDKDTFLGELKLVASPGEFAKNSPKGATFGTGIESSTEDPLAKANAALGYKFQFQTNDDCKRPECPQDYKYTFSLTPFAAIALDAVDAKRFAPTAENPLAVEDTKTQFADLSAGLRLDVDLLGKVRDAAQLTEPSKRISWGGVRKPSIQLSLMYEWFTDNYNQQNGQRVGFEFSPPAWFFMDLPGYRQRYEFIGSRREFFSGTQRGQRRQVFGSMLSGWSLEWDADYAYDEVSYDRAPLNFETPQEGDRIRIINLGEDADSNPSGENAYGIHGVNLDVGLKKQNLFGLMDDDGWLEFNVKYYFRDGYEGEINNTSQVEISSKLSLPDNPDMFIEVTYQDGRDFKTLQEPDLVSLNFGFQF